MEMLLKMIGKRLVKIAKDWETMRLPAILKCLRHAYGQSRRNVSNDTGIQYDRLFHLENGSGSRGISTSELSILSTYYAVQLEPLIEKANEYELLLRGEG